MADLYPTKTRLALLRAIHTGEVTGYPYYDSDLVDYYMGAGPHASMVTARTRELIGAGWVAEPELGGERRRDFTVELTEAGRRVLEEADRG